ncbi:VOC family protein [Pedobacter steynii]|uniref:Glyoxalase n=1 Tax=Pedobacter steynii TaxID=430522 RepID=A0A1D7QMY4_9SPHI|nr:VOC family protein [Pedobacter steynii]AOM80017.1 glyoxalase [Pedobacter steynii]
MQQNLRIGSVVIHCYEFEKMMDFWTAGLNYIPREPAEGGWVVLTDPTGNGSNLSLQKVADKRSGPRSRLHLDLYTYHQIEEVERLLLLGARRYPWHYEPGDDFVVLADPDDNLFCIVQLPVGKDN